MSFREFLNLNLKNSCENWFQMGASSYSGLSLYQHRTSIERALLCSSSCILTSPNTSFASSPSSITQRPQAIVPPMTAATNNQLYVGKQGLFFNFSIYLFINWLIRFILHYSFTMLGCERRQVLLSHWCHTRVDLILPP